MPFGAPVVLVLPEPLGEALAEAIAQLVRIGYDRIAGVLEGGIEAWVAAGGALATYPTTTLAPPTRKRARRIGYALDVRDPREWREEGFVPAPCEIEVGELQERLDTLPRDRTDHR